jgi:hypothetical protein
MNSGEVSCRKILRFVVDAVVVLIECVNNDRLSKRG